MFLIKLISFIFAFIPDRLVMGIARLAALFFYPMLKRGKLGLKVHRIIPKIFSYMDKQQQKRVLKDNALHLMKFAGEMFKAHYITDRGLEKKCYIGSGKEHLETLINSGQGFMIVTCHLGNWEYGAAYLALRYRPIFAPVFVENSKANQALNWIRDGHRVNLLPASRNPKVSTRTFLRMRELLNRGEIVYLVADQAALGGDIKGIFFGKELRIFGGPFILGRKTGKPVLPMFTLRDKKNRIILHFEKPFFLKSENQQEDIQKVLSFFERNIRSHPEQYLWSQDRW